MKTVILSFSIGHSSVCDYFIQLSNALARHYRVIIVTDKIADHPFTIDSSIMIHKWPSPSPTTFKDFVFLLKLFREVRPSMTISNFGSVNMSLIVGWLTNVKRRISWMHTLSTQFPLKQSNVYRKQLIFKLGTNFIANSEATRLDAISVFNVSDQKIKVLPNSVANYYQKYASEKIYHHKIVYVGRLHISKGVDVLVKAFAEVRQQFPESRLEIIGSGPSQKALVQLVFDLGIADFVQFTGNLAKADVLKVLGSACCSVVPSNSEAFGYTVIEAMSMKTCVIGADNTGISEIIVHNESGLHFKTGDFNDLADKILKVLSDKSLRDKLALGGYNRFMQFYNVEMAVERDFNYFKNLL